MRLKISCLKFCAAICLSASIAAPSFGATPEQVDAAIEKGVNYLKKRQSANGNWENVQTKPPVNPAYGIDAGQWGGVTSLVTYALLATGEKATSPKISAAADWLRGANISGHYAIGMRANVWLNLPATEANKRAALRDSRLLQGGASKAPANRGLYDYIPGPSTRIDLSCSQYGILGSWAVSETLEPFDKDFWNSSRETWRKLQDTSGGWAYSGPPSAEHPINVQMTAAGVASLFIMQEYLDSNQGIDGTQGNLHDLNIEKGLNYLSKNYEPMLKEDKYPNRLYALYGIERVGVASGYKNFGNLDWFDSGADFLLKQQSADGSWSGDLPQTSWALLFLSRGRAPVMVNKLSYEIIPGRMPKPNGNAPANKPQNDKSNDKDKKEPETREANWNQRTRDVANVTRWVSRNTERSLNWQIINLSSNGVRDLHDSPILYISGNQPLNLREADRAKLKQYIEEGGIIIGNADAAKKDFTESFRALGSLMFPEYEFKPIPDDHPLMVNEYKRASEWKRKPNIEVMGNGARLFMILIPNADFGRDMQLRNAGNRPEVFEFWANLFLYSVDKDKARFKGMYYTITPDESIKTTSTIKVGRLKYSGVWNPEPGGWKRLSGLLHNKDKIDLQIPTVELGKDKLSDYKILHLTGTRKFAFNEDQRKALKDYVSGGGLLVIDSCGGQGDFDGAVQSELSTLFPGELSQIQNPADPAKLKPVLGGDPLEPKYRVFAMQKLGTDAGKLRLRAMSFKVKGADKVGVIYSSDDISTGLVGQAVDGIIGYDPDTATEIMRRIILNAGK